jgi:GNAT superfamily N-acetyltransferase
VAQSVGNLAASGIAAAAAEEYMAARVAVLAALSGNPYGAELHAIGQLRAFLVRSTSSPMMNQIRGDCRGSPEALSALVAWFAQRRSVPAVSLIFQTGKPPNSVMIGGQGLRRLNGWTHVVLAAPVSELSVQPSPLTVEELTADSVEAFTRIHADAFHTAPERKASNHASFAGLIAGEHAKGFLVRIDGKPAAGGIVYFASNGVAYLGTAATRRDARGQGCHSALILCRIAAARERGCQFVAATATPNSQSRRNLERFGMAASHTQALYSPQPSQR